MSDISHPVRMFIQVYRTTNRFQRWGVVTCTTIICGRHMVQLLKVRGAWRLQGREACMHQCLLLLLVLGLGHSTGMRLIGLGFMALYVLGF